MAHVISIIVSKIQVCKAFYFPGGLLFTAQPSRNLKSSPAQHGAVIESARDSFIQLNISWNEMYAGGVITKVGKSFNINNTLKKALFIKYKAPI